jgi:hypothetical protein
VGKYRKIRAGHPNKSGVIPSPVVPADSGQLTFSFKLIDCTSNQKFTFDVARDGYPLKLFQRLKSLCSMTWPEIRSDRSPALRAHPINFSETSEPGGFSHLNEQFRALEPWQISVSSNEHGRVHGVVIGNVFYVVWIDPDHRLYDNR